MRTTSYILHLTSYIALLSIALTANAQLGTNTSLNSQLSSHNSQLSQMPIRLPLSMSGGFAEIRPNHFHSGIDIRTDGKEGEPVYAPADGYVSRINISAWGGGKILYITHPDGYRTVYMHLSAFCGKTAQFVHDYQYHHQLFAFDIDLPRDSIKVKKGELVALTGNTGGSMGPHLHYEIRLAENDQTINPLYFGLPYKDPIAPTIAGIKIYPASPSTTINGSNQELKIYPKPQAPQKKGKKKSNSKQQTSDTVTVSGRFYTGIYTYDQMEPGSGSKNGIEKIELYVDDQLFHSYRVSSFMFEETRAINALIDYRQYQRNREYYILSRRLHGDPSGFNTVSRDYGYLLFDDGKTHKMQYSVTDYKGNAAARTFYIRGLTESSDNPKKASPSNILAKGENIIYYKPFTMSRDGFVLNVEANNIYENDEVIYRLTSDKGGISQLHNISLLRNPLPPHDKIEVTLAIPSSVPQKLRQKLTIVCINGKSTKACTSTVKGNQITASSRSWGGFALRLDTIAPTVQPIDFADGKALRGNKITVRIGDDLSGVAHYSCHVDSKWQLAEHDGKTSSLTLDGTLLKRGRNTVSFTITDAVGNTTTKEFTIMKN